MSDWGFRAMTWTYKLVDLFSSPARKLSRLPLHRGMVVVDYACGPGRYTIPVARFIGPGGRVYAVDNQPLAIRSVAAKAARASLTNVVVRVVESYNTGIPDRCADLVLLLDAFHQITDRSTLLSEVGRIIKPDGIFLMEPGHMDSAAALGIVTATGRFRHTDTRGKDLWFAPVSPVS